MEASEKENAKNKETLNEAMNTIVSAKRSINLRESGVIGGTRKKESMVNNLSNSRAITNSNTSYDIRRMVEVIENSNKEQQNTIASLNDNLLAHQKTIDKLEK